MSKETLERCIQQYKTNKEVSPADYAKLTEGEESKLAHVIVSNMSTELQDMFVQVTDDLTPVCCVFPTKEG